MAESSSLSALDKKREEYKTKLQIALQEEEDPLALYEQFIKWTVDNYPDRHLARSGLLVLLEEATRQFQDDAAYKGDLRYLKLWSLYARHVEDPVAVYQYLVSHDIGIIYAQVYEEYAAALEKGGRRPDAEKVYLYGIKRRARPVERLKKRYNEFQARASNSQPPPRADSSSLWQDAPPEVQAIRRNPLRNHLKNSSSAPDNTPSPTITSAQKPSAAVASSSTANGTANGRSLKRTKTAHDRYAPMLAPPAPGKRPEKLRFNLSVLFTDERNEYSVQEVRARSMGLLGKKWAPVPIAKPTKSVRIDPATADGGTKRRGMGTSSYVGGGAEPTVTLATKEALADVFGMYNSPEKSTRFGVGIAGSKHAPVRRIEPVTPMALHQAFRAVAPEPAENDGGRTPGSFKPFVDENANTGRKENRTPAASGKFTVFVDEDATPAQPPKENRTPGPIGKFEIFRDDEGSKASGSSHDSNGRAALGAKAPVASSSTFAPSRSASGPSPPESSAASSHARAVSGPVFSLPAKRAAPSESQSRASTSNSIARPPVFQAPAKFVPLRDAAGKPAPVFSLPSTTPAHPESKSSGRAALGQKPVFTPALDEPPADRPPVFSRPSSSSGRPAASAAAPAPAPETNPFQPAQQIYPAPLSVASSSSTDDDIPPATDFIPVPGMMRGEEELYDSSESDFVEEGQNLAQIQAQMEAEGHYTEEDSMFDEQDEVDPEALNNYYNAVSDDQDSEQEAPLGGRLGRFDIMTPIAERTYEYTASMRGTPSGSAEVGLFSHSDALKSAEQLAAELQAGEGHDDDRFLDREEDDEDDDHLQQVEERTGTLSLGDVLLAASSFNPPNPCNPFDAPIISSLISFIPPDAAFHDLRGYDSNRLDALQKFAKRQGRKSAGSGNDEGLQIQLSDGRTYAILQKLGEGGFGAVFEAIDEYAHGDRDPEEEEFEDEDEIPKVALKVVRPRGIWEFHVLRRVHQRISDERLRRSIVTPESLHAYRDESFLVLELCRHGTLLEIVNKAGQAGLDKAGSCILDELLIMFFAIELMRLLEGLHRAGFIHGDMKVDNCLLRLDDVDPPSAWSGLYQPDGSGGWDRKGIKLIDFGRTVDTQLFPAGQTFVGDWDADARDCFELREGRPWTYQTDYFGLAGIIYCMLYGKYIDAAAVVPAGTEPDGRTRYKLAQPLKRYWQVEIWTRLFDMLLNSAMARPDGKLPLCDELRDIRLQMEAWLQANCNRSSNTLKGLLKKVSLCVLGGKDGR